MIVVMHAAMHAASNLSPQATESVIASRQVPEELCGVTSFLLIVYHCPSETSTLMPC